MKILSPGDVVQVLPWRELRSTLDVNGMLDRLPFMPEMVRFCGQHFVVSTRIDTTCDEAEGRMRKIAQTVYLDGLRCDGSEHGACKKYCGLLWKEAWLRRVGPGAERSVSGGPETGTFPYNYVSPDGLYICQATELKDATTHLRWRDIRVIVRGLHARSGSALQVSRTLAVALWARLRSTAFGTPYSYLPGSLARTPRETLNLSPGEWVRVRDKDRIVATLDKHGRNRGLRFTADMAAFCGGTYRVLRRLDKIINERRRTLVRVEDTVLLEQVTCRGRYVLRGGCPRAHYHYWREIWLERVEETEGVQRETR